MSFMHDMDFSQQAAILGDEDVAGEEPVPEVAHFHTESAKKSKKQPVKEPMMRYEERMLWILQHLLFICYISWAYSV